MSRPYPPPSARSRVETPGGGRIRDKRDPAPGDLVTVHGVNGPVQLQRLAALAWAALVDAARAEGLREPLLLPASGYRSSARQARLYQLALDRYHTPEQARRWVAPPGGSAHQSGRAIDFYLGGRNASSNVAALRRLPGLSLARQPCRTVRLLPVRGGALALGIQPADRKRPCRHPEGRSADSRSRPPRYRRRGLARQRPGPATADPWSSGIGSVGIRAGRHEVPSVPVLARHRGRAPALVLRWNDMASAPAEIDVVVHLHGFSQAGPTITGGIERYSGLDLVPVDGALGQGQITSDADRPSPGRFLRREERLGGLVRGHIPRPRRK